MNNSQIAEASVEYRLVGEGVPAGYRQTEVGVIPEDWQLLTVNDVANFTGGSQPPRSTFVFTPKAGYIRLIQIRDYKTSEYVTYIPEVLARKTCKQADIMIGRYGPPIFQILRGIEGAYNVALIKASPKPVIEREYLFYFLKSEKLFELMDMLSQRSSGQTGVELPALKAYPIPLPSKKEQTAIANALSDVDTLISELEKLIAKKQAIKTATMQQLLTGRTRLPQFALREDGTPKGYKASELGEIPEDWDIVRLGTLGSFSKGAGVRKDEARSGTLPCIRYGEIYTMHNEVVRNFNSYISQEVALTSKKISTGDILFAGSGETKEEIGKCVAYLGEGLAYAGGDIVILSPKESDSRFLGYMLNSPNVNKQKASKGQGDAVVHISAASLSDVIVVLPSEIEEQTAIATILSDMDEEIQTLQQRLSKTRQIKQGMMQELLTGKTRLIKSVQGAA